MSNQNTYDKIFISTFKIKADQLSDLKYQDLPLWDSAGHMNMISQIESAFNIMMEPEDIIDFSSYKIGFEILKKYGVPF